MLQTWWSVLFPTLDIQNELAVIKPLFDVSSTRVLFPLPRTKTNCEASWPALPVSGARDLFNKDFCSVKPSFHMDLCHNIVYFPGLLPAEGWILFGRKKETSWLDQVSHICHHHQQGCAPISCSERARRRLDLSAKESYWSSKLWCKWGTETNILSHQRHLTSNGCVQLGSCRIQWTRSPSEEGYNWAISLSNCFCFLSRCYLPQPGLGHGIQEMDTKGYSSSHALRADKANKHYWNQFQGSQSSSRGGIFLPREAQIWCALSNALQRVSIIVLPSACVLGSKTNRHKQMLWTQTPWIFVFGRSYLKRAFVSTLDLGIHHLLWSIPSLASNLTPP